MNKNEIIQFLKTWEGPYNKLPEEVKVYVNKLESYNVELFNWQNLEERWLKTIRISDVPSFTFRMNKAWHFIRQSAENYSEPEPLPETCENCRFMKPFREWFYCHKKSPVLVNTGSDNASTEWPGVALDDFCGEFEPKKKES